MAYIEQKACALEPLYSFFGDVKCKPLLVDVIWSDSGYVRNVSTSFYLPELSPRLVGLEKMI